VLFELQKKTSFQITNHGVKMQTDHLTYQGAVLLNHLCKIQNLSINFNK